MGVGSRNHRIKLQRGKGKRIVKRFDKFDSTEDDELQVFEQGGEHDGDKKKIKEKNEISETVITINHQLQQALTHTSASASNCPYTIGRAPPKLRKLHEHGFHPTLVAIGPLHSHDPHLKPMEAHKLRFLLRLLENMSLPHQAADQNGTLGKEVLVEEIASQQQVVSNQNEASCSRTNGNEKKIEYLVVLEQGGNIGEHDGDKKIKEKNEISETVITINHQLQQALTHTSASASNCSYTICRAPPKLRKLHEHGFHPTLVAIGPLHRHDLHLKPMEAHKLRFLHRLLENMTLPLPHQADDENETLGKEVLVEEIVSQQQVSNQNGASCSSTNGNEKKIEYLVVAMKELEARTRACYSETFSESSMEFVMMMIFDSCFVIQLLRLYAKWGGSEKVVEPFFNTRWMVQSLKHDLIMLENQLPLTVLEKIFYITRPEEDRFTLKDLTLKFFNSLLPSLKPFSGPGCRVDITPKHLLGLFRSSFQVRNPPRVSSICSFRSWVRILLLRIDFATNGMKTFLRIPQTDHKGMKTILPIRVRHHSNYEAEPSPPLVHDRKLLIHCVTELKEAGISFKKGENRELLDIEFKNGKLYIPPLLIDDHTGLMLLNFVAYEQCNPWTQPYFTTYLLFWDSLLNSSKDVEHLHSEGIIDHVLGSDEDVAKLFNMLCREVVHDLGNCYLKKVLEDVNQYFGVRRHRWRAKLTHDYFSSPWAFISLIAAVFLLVLTLIQAFFAVLAYVVPPS